MTAPEQTIQGARRLLVLDEDQRMLLDAAKDLLAQEAPVSQARGLRDDGEVFDASLWQHLVDQGWAGLMVPEDHDGLGMGLPVAVGLMEAIGSQIAATPMVSAIMVGPLAPQLGIADGRRVSLAWQEDLRRPDPAQVSARWAGGKLNGNKSLVLDGTHAEGFVVSALDEDGKICLVYVSAEAAEVHGLARIDHRDVANVVFQECDAVSVPGGVAELIQAVDRGTIALSAELLGLGSALFERTLDYLRTREQFGRPLGSFQALKHRAVDVFVGLELSRSAVLGGAFDPCPLGASLAKAQASEAVQQAAREGIQMHGGIGMTDEHDAGLYVKRIWCAASLHGDTTWHRQRWASLREY